MLSCIVGVLMCGNAANMVITGPLSHAQPAATGFAYVVYVQPLQSPRTVIFRRV